MGEWDEDDQDFDAWGGDVRQLGVARGMYSSGSAPPAWSMFEPKASGATTPAAKEAAAEHVKVDEKNSALGLRDWLLDLDNVGFLLCYLGELKQNFNSLAQVVDVYAAEGKINPQFFEDFGVRKLGHRRLF